MPEKLRKISRRLTKVPHVRCEKIMAMQPEKTTRKKTKQLSWTLQPVAARTPKSRTYEPPVLFRSRPSCTLSQPAAELSPLPDDVMNHWPHTAMKLFWARESCIMENNRPTHRRRTCRPLHQIDAEWAKLAINCEHGVINVRKGRENRQTNSYIALAGLMIFCWARKQGCDGAAYEEL